MLDFLAERRIAEAVSRGELAGLPGEGRPLDLGDDALVPEEVRVAYRILKNAGCLPPELEGAREGTPKERALWNFRALSACRSSRARRSPS